MKIKIAFIAMLLFAGVLTSQAQNQRRTPEERMEMTINRLNDSLKLSDAQKADLKKAYLEFYQGQDKLREGLQPGQRPERADMDKLSDARDVKLKAILKEDQFFKLKELEAAMRNRQQGQRPPGQ